LYFTDGLRWTLMKACTSNNNWTM